MPGQNLETLNMRVKFCNFLDLMVYIKFVEVLWYLEKLFFRPLTLSKYKVPKNNRIFPRDPRKENAKCKQNSKLWFKV